MNLVVKAGLEPTTDAHETPACRMTRCHFGPVIAHFTKSIVSAVRQTKWWSHGDSNPGYHHAMVMSSH
jgi:hypothetical protein